MNPFSFLLGICLCLLFTCPAARTGQTPPRYVFSHSFPAQTTPKDGGGFRAQGIAVDSLGRDCVTANVEGIVEFDTHGKYCCFFGNLDPATGEDEAKTVTFTIERHAPSVVDVTLHDARTGKAETLTCTPEHPLFVQGQGWVEAGSVGIGTSIVSRAGPALQVTELTWEKNKAEDLAVGSAGSSFGGYTVYNLTVEGDHTFFVGTSGGGTWVHNTCTGTADELYNNTGKAPWQTTPGTNTLEGQYVNDIKQVQPWRAHYDQFGRQIGRTDYNAGNPATHFHTYGYNNGIRFPILDHVPGEFIP